MQWVPLGKIVVASAGTAVPVLYSGVNVSTFLTPPLQIANGIQFRALTGNTGKVYILSNGSSADTTAFGNVVQTLNSAGELQTFDQQDIAAVDPRQFWVDVDTSGQGLFVTLRLM